MDGTLTCVNNVVLELLEVTWSDATLQIRKLRLRRLSYSAKSELLCTLGQSNGKLLTILVK